MSSVSDPYDRARKRLADTGGKPWKPIKDPNCPKEIVIRVLRVEERTVNTGQGPASCVVVSGEDEQGTVWDIWAWHTVLHNELVRAAPQPADVIGVSYLGKHEPEGGGNGYERYRVSRADEASCGEFDWTSPDKPEPSVPTRVVDEQTQPEPELTPDLAEDDIPF